MEMAIQIGTSTPPAPPVHPVGSAIKQGLPIPHAEVRGASATSLEARTARAEAFFEARRSLSSGRPKAGPGGSHLQHEARGVAAPHTLGGDAAVTENAYNTDLDKNAANFQPLTPLAFLERAASVHPDQTAVIHGALRRSYRDFYARCRRLASALAKRGLGPGDTVSVVLPNTPAMLECHYGVPMAGAVL